MLVDSSVSLLMDRSWSIDEGRSSSYNYFTRRYFAKLPHEGYVEVGLSDL
jgi:hypothetical protein